MSRPPTFAPPAGTRAHSLRTSRGTFATLVAPAAAGAAGTGAPAAGRTALLLPGFTGSKEDFVAMLRPLATAGYRVLAIDGRGQYESAGPDDQDAYAQGELARDVLAQAEAAGTPVHLVGHSLGGQIARAAVLLDPTPFASLTLISSGPARVNAAQQEKIRLLSDALAALTMEQVWDAMRAMDPPQDADPVEEPALRRRWLMHNPAQLIATGRQLTHEPDRVDELAALPLAQHVVSGERDDTWPVPLLDEMAVRLGAARSVITGAEHSPNTDRPERTAEVLAAFWDAAG
ncbi:alpha/beta fold hydrolase [Streptomyces sp. NBC_00859]|uniref:alpha/beta fold hydrolase n=1 Tax=Streptomyces sp. NBC_00859 TaxID=2903682 RepID=UPI003864BD36|nr:alpha/beta fold hydrolase [Streptomyces sp. NBC_00859]